MFSKEPHLSQSSYIKPMLDRLKGAGAPTDHLLRRSGIERFRIDDPYSFIPVNRMYAFFDSVSIYVGSNQLAAVFFNQYCLANLGHWGRALAGCRNLNQACANSQVYDRHFQTNLRIRVRIMGAKSAFFFNFIDRPSLGRSQAELLSFLPVLDGFRLATGPKWAPLEIHVRGDSLNGLEGALPTSKSLIRFNQPSHGLIFPTALLPTPMKGPISRYNLSDQPPPPKSLADKLYRLFDSVQPKMFLGIDFFAEVMDMSPRSLQRRLALEGTSFSNIIDQWRFETALELLAIPNLLVREISENLGYSNPSNFERAFRRWTGTSARRYQDNSAKVA